MISKLTKAFFYKAFALLWSLIFCFSLPTFGQEYTYEETVLGKQAPLFELIDLEGKTYRLAELQKEYVVVLNFWFMGCGPCIQEFGSLNRLKERFKNEKVLFLGITTDEDLELLRVFLKRYSFNYQVLPHGKATAKAYQVLYYPSNLVIDTQGKIIFAKNSDKEIDLKMAEAIQKALNQKKE